VGGARIRFEWKINVLALAAFILSSVSLVFYGYAYWKGADVQSYSPHQIGIRNYNVGDIKEPVNLVQFMVPMVYVNNGYEGYNGVVTEERIEFTIGKRTYVHHWFEFVRCSMKGGRMQASAQGDAEPVLVPAKSAASHMTAFYPRPEDSEDLNVKQKNFVWWDDFYTALKNEKELVVKVVSTIKDGKRYRERTHVLRARVDQALLKDLAKNGWASPACWEVQPERH
jgi:hypothetical protein